MRIDFSKQKADLDAQYKTLDAERQKTIELVNQIWEEQLKLRGKYKMIEELEIMTKEAEKEPALGAEGEKKNKK